MTGAARAGIRILRCTAAIVMLAAALPLRAADADGAADSALVLPGPTGPYGVGTAVWHWSERAPAGDTAPIEVMAQLWYPGDTGNSLPARYRPLGDGDFARVQPNAHGAAPFAGSVDQAPVVVLCPGRGTSRSLYTVIAEDLASRGLAVLAVDIPEIGSVEFPDGRVVPPSDRYRPSFELITGPYEKVDEFFEPAVDKGLAHLDLALSRLADIDANDPAGLLTGRLDMSSMGAFGHSLGGRLCGALTESRWNITAIAAMEGVPPRDVRRGGMRAASLMLYSSELPEDMALPNIREVFDHRGAEATVLRLEGFGHNSVTDLPLLFPDRYQYAIAPRRALDVTRRILAAFFEAHLAGGTFEPDSLADIPEVTVIESAPGPG